uniref:RBR-type E3 ubiquitin transferase n=1 Tax=Rhabditophanes sp. KR3021 TaxID=114890 RepID=A0AC35TG08_9BILA
MSSSNNRTGNTGNLDTLPEDSECAVEEEPTVDDCLLEKEPKAPSAFKATQSSFTNIISNMIGRQGQQKGLVPEEDKGTHKSKETANLEMGEGTSKLSSSTESLTSKNVWKECPMCTDKFPMSLLVKVACCNHRSCSDCIIQYLTVEIMESRVMISCPECSELIHPNDIYTMLHHSPDLLSKYENFSLRRVLALDPDTRWCPSPDCDFAVIAQSCAACPQIFCERPGCNTSFCYHCKSIWHESQTCEEAKKARNALENKGRGGKIKKFMSGSKIKKGDIKPCPRCKTLIVKMNDGSCNHISCLVCNCEFCWLCLQEISDLHYLTISGCSFWGKKPWSRKKKLLWQVGTLVGAPIGIAFIAGLAIPGIIGGFPFLIGRRVYQKLSNKSPFQRRLLTGLAVAGSGLAGPVLAVMAVGVGVPIMLAYVYGVVPLSMCRNGTSNVDGEVDALSMDSDEMFDVFEDEFPSGSKSMERVMNDMEMMFEKDHGTTSKRLSLSSDISKSTVVKDANNSSMKSTIGQKNGRFGIKYDHFNQQNRRNSVDSVITANEEKTNYDDASLAGCGQQENVSYTDNGSTKALSGSVVDNKSLTESSRQTSVPPINSPKINYSGGGDDAISIKSSLGLTVKRSTTPKIDYASYNESYPFEKKIFNVNDGSSSSSKSLTHTNEDPYHIRSMLDRFKNIVSDDVEEPPRSSGKENKKVPKVIASPNSIETPVDGDEIATILTFNGTHRTTSEKKKKGTLWSRVFTKKQRQPGSEV